MCDTPGSPKSPKGGPESLFKFVGSGQVKAMLCYSNHNNLILMIRQKRWPRIENTFT